MQATQREILRQFVIENFLFGRDDGLRDADSFLENGIIDSTGVLELVGFLEQRFGIQVADDELVQENLDSIDNLARFLSEKHAM
jgi:acyl carrier protein